MNYKKMMARFDAIDTSMIADEKLRNKAIKMKGKRKQAGFTLLELLVVVAILAAIAGTTAIALQDTDARASAAAHVAMMDELDKGIRTFRVLQRNAYPDNFDSIMELNAVLPSNNTIATGDTLLSAAALGDLRVMALSLITHPDDSGGAGSIAVDRINDIGITQLRVASSAASTNPEANPEGDGDCSNHQALIASRGNAVVAGNIFLSPAANGCGYRPFFYFI